jgi:AcrR family transcriptional regulator
MSLRKSTRSRRKGAGRRTGDELRHEALIAARQLLLTLGPAGVTLTAVAEQLGGSHSNLIHHFGSAEQLQSSLMSSMVTDLSIALSEAFSSLEPGEVRSRRLVDAVFDAFDRGGAGVLSAWIVMSHKQNSLEPVQDAVLQLAHGVRTRLERDFPDRPHYVPASLLMLTLCAFADALIGRELTDVLHVDRDATRQLAVQLLPRLMEIVV